LNYFPLNQLFLCIPCGHRCFCVECEPFVPHRIRETCPSCRTPTEGFIPPSIQ
jgi:hypothetical protein